MGNRKNGNILGIITARGGSKRVLRKNVRELDGVPLIAHSIKAALGVEEIDRLIVSTDDEEIAEVSKHFGAEVPFMRPAELATSDCPTYKVLQHAVEWMEKDGFKVDTLLLIQPTAPFVTAEDISKCLSTFEESDAYDLIVAACKAESNHIFYVDDNKYFKPVRGESGPLWHDEKYMITGSVYVYDAERVKTLTESLTDKTGFCLVDKHRAIDIDTEDDFKAAEKLAEKLKES